MDHNLGLRSDHAEMDRHEIVGFFAPATNVEIVRALVEYIYAEKSYTLDERVAWTIDPSKNPYRATIEKGQVHCGHNPWLWARIVDDLDVFKEESGKLVGAWKERASMP
jgi:hypothetical protein